MTGISFYLLTDTHYFEPSLGASGKGYDEYMKGEQCALRKLTNLKQHSRK